MDEEERSPAGQDGAERKSNDESEALRTTTPPLPQGQKTNGQPIALACEVQTELGVILTDIAYVFSIHLSLPTGAAEAIALWVPPLPLPDTASNKDRTAHATTTEPPPTTTEPPLLQRTGVHRPPDDDRTAAFDHRTAAFDHRTPPPSNTEAPEPSSTAATKTNRTFADR